MPDPVTVQEWSGGAGATAGPLPWGRPGGAGAGDPEARGRRHQPQEWSRRTEASFSAVVLKGLSHEMNLTFDDMDLTFDDMNGKFLA